MTGQPTDTSPFVPAQAPLRPLSYLRWLRQRIDVRGVARAVLAALASLVDNATGGSSPWHPITLRRLSEAAGFCRSAVCLALRTLEASGLVGRIRGRRMRTGDGWEVEPTRYQLYVPPEAQDVADAPAAAHAAPVVPRPQERPAPAPQRPIVVGTVRGTMVERKEPPPPGVRQPWGPWQRVRQGVRALFDAGEVTAMPANELLVGALPEFAGDLTDVQRGRAMMATALLRTKGLDLAREAAHLGLGYGTANEYELERIGREWARKVVLDSTRCETGGAMLGALRAFMRSKAEFRGAPQAAERMRREQDARGFARAP